MGRIKRKIFLNSRQQKKKQSDMAKTRINQARKSNTRGGNKKKISGQYIQWENIQGKCHTGELDIQKNY